MYFSTNLCIVHIHVAASCSAFLDPRFVDADVPKESRRAVGKSDVQCACEDF